MLKVLSQPKQMYKIITKVEVYSIRPTCNKKVSGLFFFFYYDHGTELAVCLDFFGLFHSRQLANILFRLGGKKLNNI